MTPLNEPRLCSPTSPCPQSHWCHVGITPELTVCCSTSKYSLKNMFLHYPIYNILVPNTCEMPIMKGHGNSYLTRWHFDSTQKKCIKFIYSGEGGNQVRLNRNFYILIITVSKKDQLRSNINLQEIINKLGTYLRRKKKSFQLIHCHLLFRTCFSRKTTVKPSAQFTKIHAEVVNPCLLATFQKYAIHLSAVHQLTSAISELTVMRTTAAPKVRLQYQDFRRNGSVKLLDGDPCAQELAVGEGTYSLTR